MPPISTNSKPSRIVNALFSLTQIKYGVKEIVFATLITILILIFVVQPVRVEGTSMQPNLVDKERLFISKFVYHFGGVERGDVVVFWCPKNKTKRFIKRIVGMPGERIEIRQGIVYVNHEPLNERYALLEDSEYYYHPPTQVPSKSYFVMGDQRSSSNDSRHWGSVPISLIFGKAVFRYWPVSKMGLLH